MADTSATLCSIHGVVFNFSCGGNGSFPFASHCFQIPRGHDTGADTRATSEVQANKGQNPLHTPRTKLATITGHDRSSTSPLSTVHESQATRKSSRAFLACQVLLGLIVGATLGVLANHFGQIDTSDASLGRLIKTPMVCDRLEWWAATVFDPIGRIFLRLVLMVVLPLVVSALILGVLGLGMPHGLVALV